MRCPHKLFVAATLAFAACTANAHSGNRRGLSVSIEDSDVTSCDQLQIRSGGREVARSEERLTLPQTSSTVRIEAAENGGVYVYGWDRQDFGVLNCKAGLTDDRMTAERKLQVVKTVFEGG